MSLVIKLGTNVIKMVANKPNTAPIVKQVVVSITTVKDRLKDKMNIKGIYAIIEFMTAVDGLFLNSIPPIKGLITKHEGKLFKYNFYQRVTVKCYSCYVYTTDDTSNKNIP